MDLSLSPEHEAFRSRVRAWLKANVPKREGGEPTREHGDPARMRWLKDWQRKLYDAGYVAMGWPKEYGGHGARTSMQQTIVNEELVLARAPGLIGMMGIQMVGPTLIQFGTDEQKRRYLPKILTAEEIWCQGYSEPGSGSDLASLKTRAELVGDEFIVNGQKVWTSNAQFADWMFCLVRTDPSAPKHSGISYLLIDMKTPGHHRAAAGPDDRRPRLQRGVLRRRARAAQEPGRRAQPGLAGGQRDAGARAQHARLDDAHAADVQRPAAPGAERASATAARPRDDPVIRQRLADLHDPRRGDEATTRFRQLTDTHQAAARRASARR